MPLVIAGFVDGAFADSAWAPLGPAAPGMNLNHWQDGAWAEGSWVPASWGYVEEHRGGGTSRLIRGPLPKYYRDLKIEDYRVVQLPADEKANAVAIEVLDKIAEIWQQLEDDDKHFAAMLAQVDQIERQVAIFIESRQIYRLVALVETRIRIEQQAAQAIADAKRKDDEEGEEFMHLFS